ncbi:DUF2849 domain-containing protein [Paeniroseomonas aquatica]|uniref:DUF2849 domain-containing protein n=1 Tax=Paeniroseomonas aquatica TaxID=373043 RepID=UPI00361ABE5E
MACATAASPGWAPRAAGSRGWAPSPLRPRGGRRGPRPGPAGERQQRVVGVYAVELGADGLPLKFRERLRLGGPSIDAEAA